MIWVYLFYVLMALALLLGVNAARMEHRDRKQKYENFVASKSYRSYFYNVPRPATTGEFVRESLFFCFVFSFIALFASFVIGMIGSAVAWGHVKVDDDTYSNLSVLNDGSGIEGRFFLGSGTINSTAVFMYYTEDNGVYTLRHVDADYATVTYTDGPPQIVYHNKKTGNEFWVAKWQEFSSETHYEFQVPRGSVKSSFNLDAK